MANKFLDNIEYANVMLALVKNDLRMGRLVNSRFENQLSDENKLTINIKRPPRFVAKDGPTLQLQDVLTGSEQLTIDQYKNVHLKIEDLESIQSFNDLMESQTVMSAASELAQTVDLFLARKSLDFPSWVGAPGNDIASFQQFSPAHTRLMEQSVPNVDLNAVVAFSDGEKIRGSLAGVDNAGLNRPAIERARIPILSEINMFATQSRATLTTGSRSNGAIDGANQNVNYRDVAENPLLSQTIDVDGLGNAGTVKKGEVFTIAGVFAINPRTREVYNRLQQFTVMEDATASADAAGEATLTISPAIIVPGTSDGVSTDANTAFATVSAAPADDAAVVWLGAAETQYPIRAAFQRQAITLAGARLPTPFSDTSSFVSDPETGLGIRYWRGSDINTGRHIHRWDMVFGASTIQNMFGTRVDGLAP